MAKRILTKEKLDKQLTGQNSTSPFMSIREGTNRKVSFDTRDELGDKIDKLTGMLGRLAAKDNHEKRPFKPQMYQGRGREQNRNFSQTIRTETDQTIGQIVEIEDSLVTGPDMSRITEEAIFKVILGDIVGKLAKGNIETIAIDVMITIEVGTDQEKGHSQGVTVAIELGVQVIVDLGQEPEPVPIGIG